MGQAEAALPGNGVHRWDGCAWWGEFGSTKATAINIAAASPSGDPHQGHRLQEGISGHGSARSGTRGSDEATAHVEALGPTLRASTVYGSRQSGGARRGNGVLRATDAVAATAPAAAAARATTAGATDPGDR